MAFNLKTKLLFQLKNKNELKKYSHHKNINSKLMKKTPINYKNANLVRILHLHLTNAINIHLRARFKRSIVTPVLITCYSV